jgi:hypothetical protein
MLSSLLPGGSLRVFVFGWAIPPEPSAIATNDTGPSRMSSWPWQRPSDHTRAIGRAPTRGRRWSGSQASLRVDPFIHPPAARGRRPRPRCVRLAQLEQCTRPVRVSDVDTQEHGPLACLTLVEQLRRREVASATLSPSISTVRKLWPTRSATSPNLIFITIAFAPSRFAWAAVAD